MMISTHQPSFDFHGATEKVLAVKPLRPVPDNRKDLLQDLNAKLIGDSPVMHTLKRSIQAVATSGETVLITGESGTGKELIARAIHDLSPRRQKPFLPVNCGALSESLLESEYLAMLRAHLPGQPVTKRDSSNRQM